MKWVLGIVINAIIFIAMAGYFTESFYIEGFEAALGASFVLAILNILVRPILIVLTLPITVVTLGLFLFIVNGITLFLTDAIIGTSFEISSFGMTIVLAFIMSVVNLIIQKFVFDKKKK